MYVISAELGRGICYVIEEDSMRKLFFMKQISIQTCGLSISTHFALAPFTLKKDIMH
jgi:hypothetical protein